MRAHRIALSGLLACAACLLVAAPAQAGTVDKLERYLERSQNRDGGYGAAPRRASSQFMSGWAALGLEAAGRHPDGVRLRSRSLLDFLERNADEVADIGSIERTMLVLATARRTPRRFAGRDLVRELERAQQPDGSFEQKSDLVSFAIFALRAAGRSERASSVRAAAGWLAAQQNDDDGFGPGPRGTASSVDDTAYAVEALEAAGRGRSDQIDAAVGYLRSAQDPSGGFGTRPGERPNAQSTAFVVQALLAAGRDPDRVRTGGSRSPSAYLRSLVQRDGSVRYSRTSEQTPVWVTAQALAALEEQPYPLARLKRGEG